MKIESTPSSSSNHVVLQRLTSKTERRGDDGELPRIGEDDIDNVIGSRKTALNKLILVGCFDVDIDWFDLLQWDTWQRGCSRGGERKANSNG